MTKFPGRQAVLVGRIAPVAPVAHYRPQHVPAPVRPAPRPRHAVPHRARARLLAGVAAVAAGVLVVGGLLFGLRSGDLPPGPTAAAAAPGSSTAGTAAQSAVGSSTQSTKVSTEASSALSAEASTVLQPVSQTGGSAARPAEVPAAAAAPSSMGPPAAAPLPQSGPGLTEPGILLMAWPMPDGSFDVVEQVRLSNPTDQLTLRPAPVQQAGQQFAGHSAAATQVQISAGDQPVLVPAAAIDAQISLPIVDADQLELRYRLADVTVRSTPSTAGRALAVIGPLTAGVQDGFPVHVVVLGDSILGLNCPLLPLAEQSCGSRLTTSPGIERELPWQLALTSVQFNVPRP